MFRFVCAVLLLLLTAGGAFGYEVVNVDAPDVNPADPWYDAGPPPNSSNVEVTVMIDVRLDQLGEAGGTDVEARVVVVVGATEYVIASTEVHINAAPLGTVVTGTAKVCLWFTPAGALSGEGFYALLGMAGLISGILQAPLTGIFLVVEITGSYEVILPLIIVSALTSTFCYYIEPASFYLRDLIKKDNTSVW